MESSRCVRDEIHDRRAVSYGRAASYEYQALMCMGAGNICPGWMGRLCNKPLQVGIDLFVLSGVQHTTVEGIDVHDMKMFMHAFGVLHGLDWTIPWIRTMALLRVCY